jgi:hypothetical protein
MADYEVFSNLLLDEIFKNKSLISWDELDAAMSRHNLDKVSITESPSVRHSSASGALHAHSILITGTSTRNMAVGQRSFQKLCQVFLG